MRAHALVSLLTFAIVLSISSAAIAKVPENVCSGWKYRVGDDPAWAAPAHDESGWSDGPLNTRWPRAPGARTADSVWFRRAFELPERRELALALGPIESAYEVYVDGVLVGRSGALEPAVERGPLGDRAYRFTASPGRHVLAIRVKRTPDLLHGITSSGHLGGPCMLGTPDAIDTFAAFRRDRAVTWNIQSLVLAVVFLVVAVQQLALFVRRRELREYLWFGLLALAMALDSLVVFEQIAVLTGLRPILAIRAGILTGAANAFFAMRFFDRMFGVWLWPRRIVEALAAFVVIAPPIGLLGFAFPAPPLAIYDVPARAFDAMGVGAAALSLASVARATLRRHPDARVIAVGAAASLLGVGYVRLAYAGLVPAFPDFPRLTHVGFFVGVLSVAVALAGRFGRLFEETAAQAKELGERATEVEKLNVELRRHVADRSQDLYQVLQQLSMVGTEPDVRPGSVIRERYEVVRALGAGAMGSVYEVKRKSDGATFAMKVMQGRVSGKAAARFARESEIAARVTHPNLVAVVDVGMGDWGSPYFVMELVAGTSLEDLRSTRFGDPAWAKRVLSDVASGLAKLHESGIIHRDLKPANVLVASAAEGEIARISDFGISRWDEQSEALSDTAGAEPLALAHTAPLEQHRAGLTATGALLGTPLYMAPELARSSQATPAADVFAFGVMGLELATGRYPFREPPILRASRGVPPESVDAPAELGELGALLVRCIAPDPGQRPSAKELRDRIFIP